jgi:pilus assembly protein CpaE
MENNVPDNLSIGIVDADESQRKHLREQLDKHDHVEISGEYTDVALDRELIQANDPDVLIIELDSPEDPYRTLELVESLKLAHPSMAVIVNSSRNSSELIMSALRAGVQEYLHRPVNAEDLDKALDKFRTLRSHSSITSDSTGRIISVFSKRGGLGVTTIAVNLSLALSEVSDQRAALVDLDLQLGDVSSFLDLAPQYDILDACGDGEAVDVTKLQSCMTPHKSGVSVLAEPENPRDSEQVTDSQVRQILSQLRSMYRHVVVDASHVINEATAGALEQSHSILVVTVATISSVRATKRTLGLFRSMGVDQGNVHVVVNRASRSDSIKVDEIESTLDHPVFWTIPNNYRAAIDAINTGIPLINGKRPSNVGKSIMQLAETLMNNTRK